MNGYPVRFSAADPDRQLNRLTTAFTLVTDEYPPFRLAP
jgi:hypothetical protein